MSEARTPNPLVEQFRKGAVPAELRLMAAQGALPLKTHDLIELLLVLSRDADAGVSETSDATLAGLPAQELVGLFKDRDTSEQVLAWGLRSRTEPELLEPLLQNRSTPDETIEEVAPNLPEALAELVVINQARLLRRTSLLEAIESNAALSNDQRRRLRELRETFRIGVESEAAQAPVEAPPAPEPTPEPTEAAPEPEAEADEPGPVSEEEAISRYLTEDEKRETEKISVVRRLFGLTTAGKVIAALKGGREERAILIRDPNRLVASAVLGSPRLTEAEVESFSSMKNVSADVLRAIGNNREWSRKYTIAASLVKNPRTPLGISLGMVSRLNPRDIKALAVDRNVPEAIRRQAKRFVRNPQGQGAR